MDRAVPDWEHWRCGRRRIQGHASPYGSTERAERSGTQETNMTTTSVGTMKAILQDAYGTGDVWRLGEIALPQVADKEVLVKVEAAGLDRGTWHLMTGLPY